MMARSRIRTCLFLAGTFLAATIAAGQVELKFGYYSDHLRAARQALDEMHALHDARKFDEIVAMMTARPDEAKKQALAGMSASRENLGLLKHSTVVQTACRAFEVRMIAHSDYENLAAIEMVVWQIDDGKARLVNYRVAPRGNEPIGPPTSECPEMPAPK